MSPAHLLISYRDTLTTAQVAAGMNAATANARRLAQDARLLLENERWPTAASVASLSIEESGKVVILRRFLTAKPEEIKGLWKEYRTHTRKNVSWILPDLVANGARRLEDFKPLFDPTSDHPQLLDAIKQIGFYTDCLGKAHWSLPSETVNDAVAKNLVGTAEMLSPERFVTLRELELWIEHLGPVWNKDKEWMERAVGNWYGAMQMEGLVPRGANKMREFVKDGLDVNQASHVVKNEANNG